MRLTYIPAGVCSTRIDLDVEDGLVRQCSFENGCEGNLRALSTLIVGRKPEELIPLLQGITCEGHSSCAAQLALALRQCIEDQPKAR